MLKNYLKVAIRSIGKSKTHSVINVLGLAVGLAACLLVITFVGFELSFEDFHKNKGRIHRVAGIYRMGDGGISTACAVAPLGPAMQDQIPEIESAVLMRNETEVEVMVDQNKFAGNRIITAGPEFLSVFTFPLVQGDPKTSLADPFSVLITEDRATTLFGNENPVNRTVEIDGHDYIITGVLKQIPPNTQFGCDFILSYSTLEKTGATLDSWKELGQDYLYLLLKPGADPTHVEEMISPVIAGQADDETAEHFDLHLQPLTDIYLNSSLSWELDPHGNKTYVYLFSVIAAILMFIAATNFINLSTAKTAHRMREVGMRKVFGAFRKQLVGQFLCESVVMTTIAMCLGLVLYELTKPVMGDVIGRSLQGGLVTSWFVQLAVPGMVVLVGVLAGSYPALFMSRFQPASLLKSRQTTGSGGSWMRKILVVSQFTIAIGLIALTLIVYQQVSFFRTQDLGFEKDNTIVIRVEDSKDSDRLPLLKQEVLNSGVASEVTLSASAPGEQYMALTWLLESATETEESPELVFVVAVDNDYITNYGLQLIQGREFLEDSEADIERSVIVNEAFVEEYGLENPIGEEFMRGEQVVTVIGVVKDFHCHPLYNHIGATMLTIDPEDYRTMSVVYNPDQLDATLASLEKTWKSVMPEQPFNHKFLDESIRANYDREENTGRLFSVFSLLAVLIAALGIFGLASFSAERRSKEVGIRKVLGASVTSILRLLSKELVLLIIAANVIAWPIAYYVADKWLEDFPYRVDPGPGVFALAGMIVLIIALGAMGYQALKAALANPVDSIKCE